MTGEHVENALRYAYNSAKYAIQHDDEEIKRLTEFFNRDKRDLEHAQERRSKAMDQKLELRAAMLELGLDPEKE